MQFLDAALAGLQVPFISRETHELGEELVGSYLYQVHLYHWLESHDYGLFLSDNNLSRLNVRGSCINCECFESADEISAYHRAYVQDTICDHPRYCDLVSHLYIVYRTRLFAA